MEGRVYLSLQSRALETIMAATARHQPAEMAAETGI